VKNGPTPGPWRLDPDGHTWGMGDTGVIVLAPDGTSIARVVDDTPQGKENAKLIASLPTLVSTLADLQERYAFMMDWQSLACTHLTTKQKVVIAELAEGFRRARRTGVFVPVGTSDKDAARIVAKRRR
jgi:hypothetical protein